MKGDYLGGMDNDHLVAPGMVGATPWNLTTTNFKPIGELAKEQKSDVISLWRTRYILGR